MSDGQFIEAETLRIWDDQHREQRAAIKRLTKERDALAEALEKIGVFAKGYEDNRPGQTGVMSIVVRAVDHALAKLEKNDEPW